MALEEHVRDGLERLSEQRKQLAIALKEEIDKQADLHETQGKPEPPLRTDTRAISVLGLRPAGLHEDFVENYVSGKPRDREAYLSEMIEDLQSFRWETDVASPGALETDLVSLADYTGKFCYLHNLKTDNPAYFEEHFPTPESRIALEAAMDMGTAITPLVSHALAENGYNFNLEQASPETLIQPVTKAAALLRAQTAGFVYRQQMGKFSSTQYSTLQVRFDEGINRNLCFIGQSLEQIQTHLESGGAQPNLNSNFWNDATNTFDCLFGAIGPTTVQGKEQARFGMDRFDMIFIDGKTVREICSEKYKNASPSVLDKLMQGEAIQAVTSGKNRVDIATLRRGSNDNVKVSVASVQADLRAIEPTVKEEYSAVRRLFNWGPFRCKTRTDRIEAMKDKDQERPMRQVPIASKCLSRVYPVLRAERAAAQAAEKEAAPEDKSRQRSSLGHLMDEEKKTDPHRTARAPEQRTRAPQPVREKGGKDDHAL